MGFDDGRKDRGIDRKGAEDIGCPAAGSDIVEQRHRRVGGLGRDLARHDEPQPILRREDAANRGIGGRLVPPQPQQGETGHPADDGIGERTPHRFREGKHRLHFRRRTLVGPQNGGPKRLGVCTDGDKTVCLAREADAANVATVPVAAGAHGRHRLCPPVRG